MTTSATARFQAAAPRATDVVRGTASPLTAQPLTSSAAWHLARRVCGAPTADIVDEITRMGIPAWLSRQLQPETIDDSRMEQYAAECMSLAVRTPAQAFAATGGQPWKAGAHAQKLLMTRPVFGNRHLLDSMAEVLGDHVYVPAVGKADSFSALHEQLIRTHALGRFTDLLHAVMTSPALLIHLDNHQSTKGSPNENLGRELLELFTVGTGRFSESDVRNSSLILTGHSFDWAPRMSYRFIPANHHVGRVQVMSFSHANSSPTAGPAVLRAYLDYLARHPATAERLARRIAVRFVSDNPSNELVQQMAKAYLGNNTAIVAMLEVLFSAAEFWNSSGHKWRRPMEVFNTVLRASRPRVFDPKCRALPEAYNRGPHGWHLEVLGHLPRHAVSITGHPDHAPAWNTTSTNLTMWNQLLHWCVNANAEFGGQPDWGRALNINVGDRALDAMRRATWQLTGYQWPAADIAKIATVLRPARPDGLTEATTIDRPMADQLGATVRLIFSSPYGFLR
ncbi:MAG: DUF1800 family protein [Propionibacteriaceae bacterium]|nr:DUF1800 family protein [Propionibacteriaceae bacterium]